jgi:hypothetical protein
MQAAANPIVVEVPTGGDDLGLDREVSSPFHFAEIRRAAGSHQSLQLPLALSAHDLDLEVPAAGRATQIVGSTAWGQRTRVTAIEDWEAAGRLRQASNRGSAVLHNQKAVPRESAGLFPFVRPAGSRPSVAVRHTLGTGSIPTQVSAGDMQHRVDVEFSLILPQVVEADVLRVADEPGCFMVERGGAFLQGADPKGDRDAVALAAQAPAGRNDCAPRVRS